MSKRILIRHTEGQREIALVQENRLLYLGREQTGIQAEQIYLAMADRTLPGMEAMFVKLGKNQPGYLPYSECSRVPRSGEKLLVQVKKPPVGEKAPYVSADLSLAGRFLILTPMSNRMGVSKKITKEADRVRLLDTAHHLAPKGMGLVMRTEAASAAEAALRGEVQSLLAQWQAILEAVETAAAPCLIRDREDLLTRLIRDEHGRIDGIVTDGLQALPPVSLPVQVTERPFDLCSVQTQWDRARQRKIWLDCGGYLIIDPTEALTVIDVNSGKYTGGKSGTESTFLKLNLEAAREIARLARLRAMGGIIIVDFVDMQEEANRTQVQSALEEALRDDPVKTVVHGFTRLGLMEMTRKKTEQPQGNEAS